MAPKLGSGNYVLLPGMSYVWRIRTSPSREAIGTGLSLLTPASDSTVGSLTPTLTWSHSDDRLFYYEVQLSKDRTFTTGAGATAAVFYELVHGGLTEPLDSYNLRAQFPKRKPRTIGGCARGSRETGVRRSQALSFKTP